MLLKIPTLTPSFVLRLQICPTARLEKDTTGLFQNASLAQKADSPTMVAHSADPVQVGRIPVKLDRRNAWPAPLAWHPLKGHPNALKHVMLEQCIIQTDLKCVFRVQEERTQIRWGRMSALPVR